MAKRQLFPNEHELCTWNGVTLTTHRVICGDTDVGGSKSILLHSISSTAVEKRDQPILWILAIVAALGGFAAKEPAGGFVIAAVLVAVYFGTRQVALVAAGDDQTISQTISGGAADVRAAVEFADRIDRVACLVTRRPEAEPRLSTEGPSVTQEQPREAAWARR